MVRCYYCRHEPNHPSHSLCCSNHYYNYHHWYYYFNCCCQYFRSTIWLQLHFLLVKHWLRLSYHDPRFIERTRLCPTDVRRPGYGFESLLKANEDYYINFKYSSESFITPIQNIYLCSQLLFSSTGFWGFGVSILCPVADIKSKYTMGAGGLNNKEQLRVSISGLDNSCICPEAGRLKGDFKKNIQ